MKTLANKLVVDAFFERLAAAEHRMLLLDYDGTLAPFRVERSAARPYEGVVEVLNGLLREGGTRVVVISGRALEDLIPLLDGVEPLPELWGTHGWERRTTDGRTTLRPVPAEAERALEAACGWARSAGLNERCERKPASVAFHLRGLNGSHRAELEERIAKELTGRIVRDGVEVHRFDGGIELRARGTDKGTAVSTLIGDYPEGAAIAYAGDDLTDEDAFRALAGRGLGVLVRGEFRETAADIWLEPPEELLDFLGRWLDIVKGA